jgi:Zn-dependent peptidase ImmA (M78 family)
VPEPAWLVGQRAAQALRLEEGLGFAPVNIWEVIRRRGVKVARREFGQGNGDGMYLWSEARKEGLIVVNASERASKQRFTAAHELGHHELHRFEGADVEIADKSILDTGNDPAEIAANAFAAYLMAPNEALQREVGDKKTKDISADDVVSLMREFGLSYEATVYRLQNAGVITAPVRQRLFQEGEGQVEGLVAQAGFDEETLFPAGEDIAARTVDGAFRLYRDAVISAERLGQIIGSSADEAAATAEARGYGRDDAADGDDDDAVLALLN